MTGRSRVMWCAFLAIFAAGCSDDSTRVSVPDSLKASTTTIDTSTASSATSTTVAPRVETPFWDIPQGLEVAVAAEDGLHLLIGSTDTLIHAGKYSDVVADPAGDGWYVQQYGDDETSIHRIGNDGGDETIAESGANDGVDLQDVGLVHGVPTVFYIRYPDRFGFDDPPDPDELIALDVTTGASRAIFGAGGWESGFDVDFGGEFLFGIFSVEYDGSLLSIDLDGNYVDISSETLGLPTEWGEYAGPGPRSITISPDSRVSWIDYVEDDEELLVHQQLTLIGIDGSNRQDYLLPVGPTDAYDLVDDGSVVVLMSARDTPGTLLDPATGGIMMLPIVGRAATAGVLAQPSGWPIPSWIGENVTDNWPAPKDPLTVFPDEVDYSVEAEQHRLVESAAGCTAVAVRVFSAGTFEIVGYSEVRAECDDNRVGWLYQVGNGNRFGTSFVVTRYPLCARGVDADGRCV